MGGFESLEKQKCFRYFYVILGGAKVGDVCMKEDAKLWLFSQNVWLKSETESEIDSSAGGVNSGKQEKVKIVDDRAWSIRWPKKLK